MDGNCKTFDTSADGFARGEGMGTGLRFFGFECYYQWLYDLYYSIVTVLLCFMR